MLPAETVTPDVGRENCIVGLAVGKYGSTSHTKKKYVAEEVNAVLNPEKVSEEDVAI
jgi:hypothetical protein